MFKKITFKNMIKKIKQGSFLFLLFVILFFFGSASFVFAASETGICKGTLSECIVTVFQTGIDIAGGIAALSFAVGAIGFMISGDNPELASSSKDRMRGSLLGILLLAGSYIIMNEINPVLVGSNTLIALPKTTIDAPPPPAGVYFYADSGCQSGSGSTWSSLESIGANIKGIEIVDDSENNFGYILHATAGLKNGGDCGEPVLTAGCQSVNGMSGAIDVFQINPDPTTSGTGVDFYSEPFGYDRGSKAGFYPVSAEEITVPSGSPYELTPSEMKFSYEGINVKDTYKNKYVYFQDRPGSIDLKGDYLVAIYSNNPNDSGRGTYCQTFTDNVTDLNAEPVVAAGTEGISYIYIIGTGTGNTSGGGNGGNTNNSTSGSKYGVNGGQTVQ